MTALDMTLTDIAVPAANAGFPLSEVPLPYWQDRPCPSWCAQTIPHQDHELYDDRMHMGVGTQIVLTLEPQDIGERVNSPVNLLVGLWQHYRECEPYIAVIIYGQRDVRFTLAEAGRLAAALEDAGIQAGKFWDRRLEAVRPYWQNLPCPGWCTVQHVDKDDPEDRIHSDGYRLVTLTMEDPAVSVVKGPEDSLLKAEITTHRRSLGVRLAQEWREYEARVRVFVDGGKGDASYEQYLDFTLAEAGELAEVLRDLVGQATGAAHG